MSLISLYKKHNYPLPVSVTLLADFGDRYTAFEAMLSKKQESLNKYAANENASQFIIDKETEELWIGFETLDYLAELYQKVVTELDANHLNDFCVFKMGPATSTGKELQRDINYLKSDI